MKLLIAIPTQDNMHYLFTQSLLNLTRRLTETSVDYVVDMRADSLVYNSRERLAARARMENFSHVLWLDTDMVFDADLFERLSAHDKDFVTAVCHGRKRPYKSCVFKRLIPEAEKYSVTTYPDDLFKIAGAGFACVLTSTKLLRDVKMKHGNLFVPSLAFGEDLAFCKKATECGYELWADPKIRPGHIGYIEITADDEVIGD